MLFYRSTSPFDLSVVASWDKLRYKLQTFFGERVLAERSNAFGAAMIDVAAKPDLAALAHATASGQGAAAIVIFRR